MSEGKRSGVHCRRFILYIYRARQGARQHGFASAGHILQQHMPATEERDDSQFDDRPFADDDLLDVRDERMNRFHRMLPQKDDRQYAEFNILAACGFSGNYQMSLMLSQPLPAESKRWTARCLPLNCASHKSLRFVADGYLNYRGLARIFHPCAEPQQCWWPLPPP